MTSIAEEHAAAEAAWKPVADAWAAEHEQKISEIVKVNLGYIVLINSIINYAFCGERQAPMRQVMYFRILSHAMPHKCFLIPQSIAKLTEMKKKINDLHKSFSEEGEQGREMITQYVSDGIDVMADKIQQIEVNNQRVS